MKDLHLLTELRQVKILADPLRQRILRELVDAEKTATQLVAEMEEAPSNLHYHVEQLHQAGLVELVRTSPKRGTTEKYYRAVAKRFEIAPALLKIAAADEEVGAETLSLVGNAIRSTYIDFSQSLARGLIGTEREDLAPHVNVQHVRASAERLEELRRRLAEWLAECEKAHDEEREVDADGVADYDLLVLFFPRPRPDGGPPEAVL